MAKGVNQWKSEDTRTENNRIIEAANHINTTWIEIRREEHSRWRRWLSKRSGGRDRGGLETLKAAWRWQGWELGQRLIGWVARWEMVFYVTLRNSDFFLRVNGGPRMLQVREKWSDLGRMMLFLPSGWKIEWRQMWKSGGRGCCVLEEARWGRLGPGILYCSAWTNVSWGNRIQRAIRD